MEKHEIRNIVRGGQVTLPKWFRDKYHLAVGSPIEFIEQEGTLLIKPLLPVAKDNPVLKLMQLLDQAGDIAGDLSEEELLKLSKQEIKKVRACDENSH
jgi:bifunctional DNA-binding transcriptional regulator/antitoxin component of YhaV-PrlF toxin-antitoxin module